MLKHCLRMLLPIVAVLLVGAGLAAAQVPEAPAWELIHEIEVEQRTNIAGFLDEDFGITTGYGGATYFTTDGGLTWTEGENQSMCRFGLDVLDADTAWTVGNGGDVRLSVDGGATWTAVTDVPKPGVSNFVSFLDATTGWVANANLVWATADGGQTWQELPVVAEDEQLFVAGVALADETTGYVLDVTARLHVTTDGGATWDAIPLPLEDDQPLDMMSHAALRFDADGQGAIVSRSRDGDVLALRTADGGATWTIETLDGVEAANGSTFYLSPDGSVLTIYARDVLRVYRAPVAEL